jgi:invasion protein IalB
MKRALMISASFAMYLLSGADAIEAASDPRASQLTYHSWTKACISSTCFVGAGATGACVPSGGGASVILTGDKPMSLSVDLETRHMLEGAISVQVDDSAPVLIPHPQCDGLACRGKIEIDGEFITRLRRSQTITLEAMTTAHGKLSISLSLADFAKAYDGPEAALPQFVEQTNEKLTEEELAKREDERKRRQCEE